jgi:hypothetical protein
MCNSCVTELFKLSIRDQEVMPPRCCNEHPIGIDDVIKLFDKNFISTWRAQYDEWSTTSPLYCTKLGCGTWIRPENIKKDPSTGRHKGTCSVCKTKVCKKCSQTWHKSAECPKDEATQKVLDLKEKEGWQTCYQCKEVIELGSGCHHMTCRCGAEFCMLCGKPWRDPECERNCPLFPVPNEDGDDAVVEALDWPGYAQFYPPQPDANPHDIEELDDAVLILLDHGWLEMPFHQIPQELRVYAERLDNAEPRLVVQRVMLARQQRRLQGHVGDIYINAHEAVYDEELEEHLQDDELQNFEFANQIRRLQNVELEDEDEDPDEGQFELDFALDGASDWGGALVPPADPEHNAAHNGNRRRNRRARLRAWQI